MAILLELGSELEVRLDRISSLMQKTCKSFHYLYAYRIMNQQNGVVGTWAVTFDLTFKFWFLCIRKYLKECMPSFG